MLWYAEHLREIRKAMQPHLKTINNKTSNAALNKLTISRVVSAHDAADGHIVSRGASLQVKQRIVLVRHAEPIKTGSTVVWCQHAYYSDVEQEILNAK